MSAFIVSERTIHRCVSAMMRDNTWQGCEWGDLMGRDMMRLNRQAVGVRYAHNAAVLAEQPTDEEIDAYRYSPVIPTRFQALVALQCFLYQCSEGKELTETLLYRDVQKRIHRLAAEIVSELPDYKAAEKDGWN